MPSNRIIITRDTYNESPSNREKRMFELNRSNVLKAVAVMAALQYGKDVYEVYQVISETNQMDCSGPVDEEMERRLVEAYTNPKVVDKEEFKKVLSELDAMLPEDKNCGIFTGMDDPAVPVFRELGAGLGATRAVALQIAHPYIAKGIMMHSNVLTNNYDRAEKTRRYTLGMLYGSKKDVIAASNAVRHLHNKVKGEIGEDVGIFNANSPFDAAQQDAIIWVS